MRLSGGTVTFASPGALGSGESAGSESFEGELLEHPQYTRPREYGGLNVPEVLLSGNHADIEAWRRRQAETRTRDRRPDLMNEDPEPSACRTESTRRETRPAHTVAAAAQRIA